MMYVKLKKKQIEENLTAYVNGYINNTAFSILRRVEGKGIKDQQYIPFNVKLQIMQLWAR